MKKWLGIFFLAFALNLLWENLHSQLYIHYKAGPITELILIRAAIFDGLIITLFSFLILKIAYFKNKAGWLIIFCLGFAVLLEIWALNLGRWQYKELMPLIPLLGVGLTPTVQLALTGYLSFRAVFRKS